MNERDRSYGTSLSVLVRTSSKASNTLLDLYFSQFPLFTGKGLDYLEWSKVLALIIKGRHQTKEGLQTSLEAKESMYSYRSSWNWEHLSTFYTLQKTPHPLAWTVLWICCLCMVTYDLGNSTRCGKILLRLGLLIHLEGPLYGLWCLIWIATIRAAPDGFNARVLCKNGFDKGTIRLQN